MRKLQIDFITTYSEEVKTMIQRGYFNGISKVFESTALTATKRKKSTHL